MLFPSTLKDETIEIASSWSTQWRASWVQLVTSAEDPARSLSIFRSSGHHRYSCSGLEPILRSIAQYFYSIGERIFIVEVDPALKAPWTLLMIVNIVTFRGACIWGTVVWGEAWRRQEGERKKLGGRGGLRTLDGQSRDDLCRTELISGYLIYCCTLVRQDPASSGEDV